MSLRLNYASAGDPTDNDVFARTVASFDARPLMTVTVNGRRVSSFVSGVPGSLLFFWQMLPTTKVFVVRTQAPYAIERIQRAFNIIPVDGRYGPLTAQAIRTRAASENPPVSVTTEEALLSYALSKAFFAGQGIVGLPADRVMPNPSNPVRASGNSSYLAVYDIVAGTQVNLGSDGLPIGANSPAPTAAAPVPAPAPVPTTPLTNVVDTTSGSMPESRPLGNGSPAPTTPPAPNQGGTGANNALGTPNTLPPPSGVTLESRSLTDDPADRSVLAAGNNVPAPQGSGRVYIRVLGPPSAQSTTFTAPSARPPTNILSTSVEGNALRVLADTPAGVLPFDFAFTVNGASRTSTLSVPVNAGQQTTLLASLAPDGTASLAGPPTFGPIGAIVQPPAPPAGMSDFAKAMLVLGGLAVIAGGVALASTPSKPKKSDEE